ncbi:MAG: YhbY family RNA-binding protein [archaeon]
MKPHNISELRIRAHQLKPTVRIGKSGLRESVIHEINKQLKASQMVKIKLLGSFAESSDRKEVAKSLSSQTNSTLISLTGQVIVLYKG